MVTLKSFLLLSFFLITYGYTYQVRIMDRGLNMEISTYQLPNGWKQDHHIVTDLHNHNRFFSSYKFDFLGPAGEVVRNVSPVKFSSYFGQGLSQAWQVAIQQQVSTFGRFQVGSITQSRHARMLFPSLRQLPNNYFIESWISGSRNGQAFEGICVGILADGAYTGQFVALVILAPKGQLNSTFATYQQIQASRQDNPQYRMRINQLNQKKSQRAHAQHQAYMNTQQQIYRLNQQAINSSGNSGGSNSQSSGNPYGPYTTQDKYNDYYKGTTSFDDAYMGYRMPVDGSFDNWFTDGYGHYFGTDDAGFDPASLGGDWHRTYPAN